MVSGSQAINLHAVVGGCRKPVGRPDMAYLLRIADGGAYVVPMMLRSQLCPRLACFAAGSMLLQLSPARSIFSGGFSRRGTEARSMSCVEKESLRRHRSST